MAGEFEKWEPTPGMKEWYSTMTIKQYSTVRLKDGRVGAVVEVFSETDFMVDVGSSPEDWETIDVTLDEIAEIIAD